MNPLTNIKNINKLNEQEEEQYNFNTSWQDQYKDSGWIFIGGLPYNAIEGNIICLFSLYGEIVNVSIVRDKGNGKSRGFCFLCYQDPESTILAVENLNGTKLLEKIIRVDHVVPPTLGTSHMYAGKKRQLEESPTTDTPQQIVPVDQGIPRAYKDATFSRALQIVIMGNQEGAPVTQEEAKHIQRLLIAVIERWADEPRPRRKPLVFHNSGHQRVPGWFFLTCSDEETRDWLLDWVPPTGHSFVVRQAANAPWPTKIVIGLGTEVIDPNRLVQLLEYQNEDLIGTDQWQFLGTEGNPEYWRFIFRVPSSTVV